MLQDFYQIMEERTKEMDPEMGYMVKYVPILGNVQKAGVEV